MSLKFILTIVLLMTSMNAFAGNITSCSVSTKKVDENAVVNDGHEDPNLRSNIISPSGSASYYQSYETPVIETKITPIINHTGENRVYIFHSSDRQLGSAKITIGSDSVATIQVKDRTYSRQYSAGGQEIFMPGNKSWVIYCQ